MRDRRVRMIAQPYDRGSERLLDDIRNDRDDRARRLILTTPITIAPRCSTCWRAATFASLGLAGRTMRTRRPCSSTTGRGGVMTEHLSGRASPDRLVAGHPIMPPACSARRLSRRAPRTGIAPDRRCSRRCVQLRSGAQAGAGACTGRAATASSRPATTWRRGTRRRHGLGLHLPRTVRGGFGDDALAGYVWPPLTTIPADPLARWNAAICCSRRRHRRVSRSTVRTHRPPSTDPSANDQHAPTSESSNAATVAIRITASGGPPRAATERRTDPVA